MAYTLTVAQAAKRLGVTVQAVYKRIRQGALDAIQVNGRWMLNDEEGSILVPAVPGRPRKGAAYVLMNGPYRVMEFNYREATGDFKTFEVFDAARAPLGTVTRNGRGNASGLQDWWQHRVIPESRAGLDAKLAQLGLESPEQIPFRNLGLSLSDQYWICPAGSKLDWHDINYFENSFGPVAGKDGGGQPWDAWLSQVGLDSPDNTSEGVLPKRWVCDGDKRLLFKGTNPWIDQQPFNEVVATVLYRRILNPDECVPYELVRDSRGDVVACSCPCFVGSDEEFIPVARVIETQGKRAGEPIYDALVRHARLLGVAKGEVELFISKMIVCDSILANGDRHTRNFGFIRDIDSLKLRMAPLFDSGNSLWFDKDESAVAQRDWSFIARPFDAVPNRQLYLAGNMEWLDPEALAGFADEAATILEESIFALPRLSYIRDGIQSRIDAVLSMRG